MHLSSGSQKVQLVMESCGTEHSFLCKGGDATQLMRSIRDKLYVLPDHVPVIPGSNLILCPRHSFLDRITIDQARWKKRVLQNIIIHVF